MQDIAAAITLVNDINALEAQLKTKQDELRALLSGPQTPPPGREKKSRKGVEGPGLNVSASVKNLVAKYPGLTVPQIMDKLNLRKHEAAVRSALKKEKGTTMVSVKGHWYTRAEMEKARSRDQAVADALNGPGGYEAMVPG